MTARPIVTCLLASFLLAACSGPRQAGSTPVVSPPAATNASSASNTPAAPIAALTASPIPPTSAPLPVGSPMKSGDYDQSIVFGGLTRTYILHIPPGGAGTRALPLVFVLHGRGGTGKGMIGTGMSVKADQANFIVVYPDGTGDPRTWNTGLLEDASSADDVGFIQALMAKFEKDLGVDSKRVFVAGFSAGAIMSYRLASRIGDQLAAIAVVEGAMANKQPSGSWVTIPNPAGPVALIVFHGEKDTHIPFSGGQGNGAGKLFVPPVKDTVASWVKSDGCTGTPTSVTSAGGNVTREDYAACAAGSEVSFYDIVDGTHEWPGPKTTGISATNLIWDFFSKHSK